MVSRVDIFSTKGGVGKTTIAIHLALAHATSTQAPVLLVDADLTGTCVGDLLQPWAVPRWHQATNLVHLIGNPERMKEVLSDPSRIPVYQYQPDPGTDRSPRRLSQGQSGPTLLFCPSHESSDLRNMPSPVLHALLGHESAGGWVQHVIESLIKALISFVPNLEAVIVDHGPGVGALQYATLEAIQASMKKAANEQTHSNRHALIVTTRDTVDLSATGDLEVRLDSPLKENIVWVINRIPRSDTWREDIKLSLSELLWPESSKSESKRRVWHDWFERRSIPLYYDAMLADAYARSALHTSQEVMLKAVEPIRARIFGE